MNLKPCVKLSVFVSFCILLLTVSFAIAADIPLAIQELNNAAEQLVDEDNYSGAIEKFQQIIKDYPSTFYAMEAQREIAAIRIVSHDAVGADAAIQQLLNEYADQPEIARCVRYISWEYIKANQPDKVKHLCQLALSRWPDHSEVFCLQRNLAVAHVLSGEDTLAEAATAKLLSDYSADAELPKGLRMIAEAYQKTERYDKAAELLLKVMRSWPEHKEDALALKRLKDLTILYIQQGNYEQADAIITNLLTNHSGSSHIGNYAWKVARAYARIKEYEKAKQLCQRVLRDLPDYSHRLDTVSILLDCLIRLDEYGQAATIATDLVENNAKYEKSDRYELLAHETLGRIYTKTDNAANAAEERIRAAKKLDGILSSYVKESDSDAIYELGEAYYFRAKEALDDNNSEQAQANYRKSIELINSALELTSSDDIKTGTYYYVLGLNYKKLEEYDKAARAFADSYQSNPKFEYADYCLFAQGYCTEQLMVKKLIPQADAKTIITMQYQQLVSEFPESDFAEDAGNWLEANL